MTRIQPHRLFSVFALAVIALAGCSPSSATEGGLTPTAILPEAPKTAVSSDQPTAPPTPPAKTAVNPGETGQATGTAQASGTVPEAQAPLVFPDPLKYEWKVVWIDLSRPVDLVGYPDDAGRVLVLEQTGRVLIAKPGGNSLPTVFLDISDRVGTKENEQGLLGIALSPGFKDNGLLYLNYTDPRGDTHISKFKANVAEGKADAASEEVLMTIDQPFPNHNGGGMVFGLDGFLYIATGDGGSGGDSLGNAQSLDTLLGKILRIDVSPEKGYTVPEDNPFSAGGGKPEIWAYGLRNPWRFTFDPMTGDLFIADVGQNKYEELDFVPAPVPSGLNFGWNLREGLHPFQGEPGSNVKLVDPVWEYDHDSGCSITGGEVYHGSQMPEFTGIYLFGDYCTGTVWGLLPVSGNAVQVRPLFQTGLRISSFGRDEFGEVYLVDHHGQVLRLQSK